MSKENQYLPEDSDLIDDLNSIGEVSTGLALSKQQMKASEIQIKATLRNRKTMVDLDKSNKKYSIVILFFATIQFVVAGLQLILDIKIFPDRIFAVFIAVLFIGAMYWLSRRMDNISLNK